MGKVLSYMLKAKNAPKELLASSHRRAERLPRPTEASQVLLRSLKVISLFGICSGYDLKYEWKSNCRFVFTKTMLAFGWLNLFYTQSLYINQHKLVKSAEVVATYGAVASGVIKLQCFETHFGNLTALVKSTLEICQQCTGIHAERLTKRLQGYFMFYKSIMIAALPLAVVYFYYPVQSYITKRELVPLVPIEIIFTDQSTMTGFCIANSITLVISCLIALTTLYMGLTFVVIVLNYGTRVDILGVNFKELDELWSGVSKSSIAYRHLFLRNICLQAIDMKRYVAEVKEIFDWPWFVYFSFAYLSQIICLYQIRVNNWIPGYGMAIAIFWEMIFACIMGTKLTLEIIKSIYSYYTVMTEIW